MKITRSLWIVLLPLLMGTTLPAPAVEDRVIGVDAEDKEMNAAIARARAKLPHFWNVIAAPRRGESDFCLKVQITDGDNVEHFWCTDVVMKSGKITAVIGNEPNSVKSVRIDQRITVPEADISDWLYFRDGKMIGNYTVRPLMKSMSPEERDYLQKMLGDLPAD
jgi:uncharacterized protein YegJ (DUF2314 family)